jgi:hypothetical protein
MWLLFRRCLMNAEKIASCHRGARSPPAYDLEETQLSNFVEEMAMAAGINRRRSYCWTI